jgi:histidinol-phosphate/aromatic aminotransferase/cobyric acid decarboxylase-like protein
MYHTSDEYVLCGLCEQEERDHIHWEVETMAAWACEQKLNFQDQLATCLKEQKVLRQQLKKKMTDHQVSQSGFNAVEYRSFLFHRTLRRERELLYCAFQLMHKIIR